MTTTIKTLIQDIQNLLKRKDGWWTDELSKTFSEEVAVRLQLQFSARKERSTLRLSQMGPRCPRSLWYSIHHPELAEPLPPWAEIKYSFGHIIEAQAIALAKAAGHEVTGEQDELRLDGIVGHRDCVIDGCTVDVKSAASMSFNKFRSGAFEDNFGYLDQLDGYILASANDPLVTVKDTGYLFVIDKQLGKMCLYEHKVTHERETTLRARIAQYREIVGRTVAPPCTCGTAAEGTSGNIKLDTRASYSPYKHICFPSLRTFLYANGPVFLSKTVKRPFNKSGPIPEVDKAGNYLYN